MQKNALVVNLTRFGDLLQSQGVIDDLHMAGYRVDMLCLDNFAGAIPFLRNVANVWPLPGSRLLARINGNWPEALAALRTFQQGITRDGSPDAILNLTPTLPARLLTHLLSGPATRQAGFGLDAWGYGLNHGVWASFFAVAAARRANSPFNLADMMRRIALPLTGSPRGDVRLKPPPESALAWARSWLAAQSGGFSPRGYVAFQLGASQDQRRWPTGHFRALGRSLWQERGMVPLLLGTAAEAELASRFAAGCDYPFVNAIGRTDPGQLGALLLQSRLLVTNDTGTMHLAAGLDLPILAIFLATAQPVDTGPLNPLSCSLEPALSCHPCAFDAPCGRNHECRGTISAATAADYALAFLDHGDFARGATAANSREARAWLTARNGFTHLVPLSSGALAGPRIWLAWLRSFWTGLLSDLENLQASGGSAPGRYEDLPAPPAPGKVAAKLTQTADLLDVVAACARETSKSLQMAKVFLRNCERVQAVLDADSALATLAGFWRELRMNQGDDTARFSEQARIIAAHVRELGSALQKV